MSSGLVTAASAQEGKLAGQRRPCISSWPQMLLSCVSVFMKCFSNKVSVLHRVRALIKCRTCAVCQLAAEAYLNAFSDTIVLRLIFSPWVFLILLVLFFLWRVSFSAYLYPLKGMSGTRFHQRFLRAWCRLPYCSIISPCHPMLSEPSMVAFAFSVIWWETTAQTAFHIILSYSSYEDILLALFILVLAHSRHSINSSFKYLHSSNSSLCGSTFLETAIS